MEVKVQLKVTAEEVFEQLLQAIISDVKKSTGQIISINRLCKGFSYKKSLRNHMGNEALVKVQIIDLVSPTKYIAAIENSKGINTIEYSLINNTEGVEIKYKESFKTNSMLLNLNYIIASSVFSISSKKRMKRNLTFLEKKALNV